jgi:hypothetical protein
MHEMAEKIYRIVVVLIPRAAILMYPSHVRLVD